MGEGKLVFPLLSRILPAPGGHPRRPFWEPKSIAWGPRVLPATRTSLNQAGASASNTFCHPRSSREGGWGELQHGAKLIGIIFGSRTHRWAQACARRAASPSERRLGRDILSTHLAVMNMPIAIVCLQNRRGNVAPFSKAPEGRALFLRAPPGFHFFYRRAFGLLGMRRRSHSDNHVSVVDLVHVADMDETYGH